MIVRPAQYLLRFDDLCPTMAREPWLRCRRIVEEFGLRPILAVVPDNRDPDLIHNSFDPGFWGEMRWMEKAGATIGLHGRRHVCASSGRSLLNLHARSEFAGVDFAVQRRWIREGLAFLRERGLTPRLWVAPRHGFDDNTLRALQAEGLPYLSDGFARAPFSAGEVTWIPQQLWGPAEKKAGLWTVCIHANTARIPEVEALRTFVAGRASQFTSLETVITSQQYGGLPIRERIYASLALARLRARSRSRRSEPDWNAPGLYACERDD